MKATQKQNPIATEQTPNTTAKIGHEPMEQVPGGIQAPKAITSDSGRAALKSPMVIPSLGFDRLYLRLTRYGFEMPKIWFNPRISREYRWVEWRNFPLPTPTAPELIAERWIQEYITRATEPSGVATKRPVKFDIESIRRWLTKIA